MSDELTDFTTQIDEHFDMPAIPQLSMWDFIWGLFR